MAHRALPVAVVLIVCLGASIAAQVGHESGGQFVAVDDHAWVFLPDDTSAPNGVLVAGDLYALAVLPTKDAVSARRLFDAADALSLPPITHVVVLDPTHAGVCYLPHRTFAVVAQRRARRALAAKPHRERPLGDELRLPEIIVEEEEVEFDLGGIHAHVQPLGDFRVAGELALHFEPLGLTLTSESFVSREFPMIDRDADVAGWSAGLGEIAEHARSRIVPGRGPVSSAVELDEAIALLRELGDASAAVDRAVEERDAEVTAEAALSAALTAESRLLAERHEVCDGDPRAALDAWRANVGRRAVDREFVRLASTAEAAARPATRRLADGRELRVDAEKRRLEIVDEAGRVTAGFDTAPSPALPVVTADERLAFVPCLGTGEVMIFDLWNGRLRDRVVVGEAPSDALLLDDDTVCAVAVRATGTIALIDVALGAVTDAVTGFLGPVGLAADEYGEHLFVGEQIGTVAVVDRRLARIVERHWPEDAVTDASKGESAPVTVVPLLEGAVGMRRRSPQPARAKPELLLMPWVADVDDPAAWAELAQRLRAAAVDVVVLPMPQGPLPRAWRDWTETGRISDRRLRKSPALADRIFPLAAALGFGVCGASGASDELERLRADPVRSASPLAGAAREQERRLAALQRRIEAQDGGRVAILVPSREREATEVHLRAVGLL